jgi:hypothetical protein
MRQVILYVSSPCDLVRRRDELPLELTRRMPCFPLPSPPSFSNPNYGPKETQRLGATLDTESSNVHLLNGLSLNIWVCRCLLSTFPNAIASLPTLTNPSSRCVVLDGVLACRTVPAKAPTWTPISTTPVE